MRKEDERKEERKGGVERAGQGRAGFFIFYLLKAESAAL